MTDLHRTAMSGNCIVVQLCLDHGAPVNAKNGDGVSWLMIAVRYEQITVVELLTKNGERYLGYQLSARERPTHRRWKWKSRYS
jgi:ankyrin repeat protein